MPVTACGPQSILAAIAGQCIDDAPGYHHVRLTLTLVCRSVGLYKSPTDLFAMQCKLLHAQKARRGYIYNSSTSPEVRLTQIYILIGSPLCGTAKTR